MFLSNLSIKRPVLATVMMLALVTLGTASYRRLAIDLYPNVEIPVITIVTIFPGASPETVEREVSKRIEEAVNPIAGVRHVGSTSREGVSQVFVEFQLEINTDRAAQDARTKIAAIRGDLPATIEDPVIEKLDIGGMPIVSLAVRSTSLSPRDLTTLVDTRVKRRLENVLGVGKVDLVGAGDPGNQRRGATRTPRGARDGDRRSRPRPALGERRHAARPHDRHRQRGAAARRGTRKDGGRIQEHGHCDPERQADPARRGGRGQ